MKLHDFPWLYSNERVMELSQCRQPSLMHWKQITDSTLNAVETTFLWKAVELVMVLICIVLCKIAIELKYFCRYCIPECDFWNTIPILIVEIMYWLTTTIYRFKDFIFSWCGRAEYTTNELNNVFTLVSGRFLVSFSDFGKERWWLYYLTTTIYI